MDHWLTKVWVVQAAIFLATTSLVLLIAGLVWRRDPRIRDRVKELGRSDRSDSRENSLQMGTLAGVLTKPKLPGLLAHLAPSSEASLSQLRTRLIRAGFYETNAVIVYILSRLTGMILPLVVCLILGLTGYVRLDLALLVGALLGGVGLLLPAFGLARLARRRQQKLRRSLSDFLDLFVTCVESGQSLQTIIGHVAEELRPSHGELAAEFSICNRQIQLGNSLEVAIQDLAERTGLEDLRSLSTFVQQSQKFGATIGAALRDLSDLLRRQREIRAEEMAQKAAVTILLPTLLFIFPAVFVILAGPAAFRIHENMSQASMSTLAASD